MATAYDREQLLAIMRDGISISTSGTTGRPKVFIQTPDKIRAANAVAVARQEITEHSRIYTVCKMEHAGGLLAQTLPALSVNAQVDIERFNPYTWVRKIRGYTHSHLIPAYADAIMRTKGFSTLDLSGIWITCGSDPVTWDIIASFVERGCIFMANWGMTEVGPIAINTIFRSMADVDRFRAGCGPGTILGDTFCCEHKIVREELWIRGDISVFGHDWYPTGDRVRTGENGVLIYLGRCQ